MRRKFQTPSTPEQGIHDNGSVVELLGMEVPVSSQSKRVLWIVPFSRRKECQVPITHHVPPKGISRVHHHCDHPHPEQRRLADAVLRWLWCPLKRAQNNDWEGGAVLEGVGEVHATPTCGFGYGARLRVRTLHAIILCYALSQSNQRGNADDERHPEGAAAIPIWRTSAAVRGGKEHAQRNKQVAEDFRV